MQNNSVEKLRIPDGRYNGKQSGYSVVVEFEDGTVSEPFMVTNGIRGINWSCGVEIINSQAIIYDTMFDIPPPKLYYIQNEYAGNICYWWKVDNQGYTCDISNARKFTEPEMLEIMKGNYQHKYKAWLCPYIRGNKAANIQAVDSQYLNPSEAIN